MSKNDRFTPAWIEQAPAPESYRSLFKWGDPNAFKHPNRGLYALLKETFGMSDADFLQPRRPGQELFDACTPTGLDAQHVQAFERMLGAENVRTGAYERTRASYGAGMIDALRLRQHIVENLPGAVLAPRSTQDVQ